MDIKDSMNAAVESSKWPTRKVASTAIRKAMKLPCGKCRAAIWASVAIMAAVTAAGIMAEVLPVE